MQPSSFVPLALASLLILGSVPAHAADVAERQSFPAERLRITPNRGGIIDVLPGAIPEHLSWDVGVWAGFAANPLVTYDPATGRRNASLVGDRVGGAFVGSLGLFGFAELGLELPAIFHQSRNIEGALAPGVDAPALQSLGLADLRVLPKVRLLSQSAHGVDLALVGGFTLPTGGGVNYFGEAGPTFAPELAVSRHFGSVRVAANAGAVLRETTTVLNQTVDSELALRLGVAWRSGEEGSGPFELGTALSSATSIATPLTNENQSHLEWRVQAGYDVSRLIQVFAGAGVGLANGWGTPDWRGYFGIRLGHWPERVATPAIAPAPEPAQEGVGAVPDSDGDGIPDADDRCPNDPEDLDGFEDTDGCPDLDDDGDGTLDVDELRPECRLLPGPVENRGCPETDTDGDSVVDRLDNCPNEPGPVANQGCPPAKKQLAAIRTGRIEILDTVYFALNKDVILPRSFPLLDNVAEVLNGHPEIPLVRVEGHTDAQGRAAANLDLSQRRAQAVVKYLVDKGVDPARLVARGYGQTRPIADNRTAAGRAKNRRVEFNVVDDAGVELRRTDNAPTDDTLEKPASAVDGAASKPSRNNRN